ncbi:MAG TPA: sulfotransferase [Chromatiaceae bacterium]|jgi:hypothetical protein|nr:MAG: hypothetical protein N838_04490 [Thiohalocapsa sp. PB-PSB1]QQO54474.1 MAG: sulfotransferase [Thiohalocapsa sp. PB-PSB1]HBG96737.1 sulfotransferase [Chromatiaceae bacterium]HCS88768.1 sulfotransferase [Chromatiaceae bacterium]
MFDLFPISIKRLAQMAFTALTQSPDGVAPVRMRRVLVMLGFLPLFAMVQGIHWLGFLLDDLLFRGWRRVEIREPLFVLGVPRSGTTRLHEILAKDQQYTTFSAWECLFALSVSERRFWLALARIDALIGAPGARLMRWIERRAFASLEDVHAMSLTTPEEDYFALMPILSCFILALPFPNTDYLWRIGRFDQELSAAERRRILDFYQGCLKKHLYVHGEQKRLLSKNAAFAPLAGSLAQRFPDARFLVCLRDPMQTLPSQLSSIASGLDFFGIPSDNPIIQDRLLDQLAFYYRNLDALAHTQPADRCVIVTLPQLKNELATTLIATYRRFGSELTESFLQTLEQETTAARNYRSQHQYSLEQFGLNPEQIETRFAETYRRSCLAKTALPHAKDVMSC